ncbi:MAG: hypothetical protein IMZ41_01880 [Actinobacteria bacterium]|nr:hypothetical protein [Actinomycetota bacterium]
MDGKNVVVTSGLGSISYNLVEKNDVTVIDDLLAYDVFKKINLEELTEIINRTLICKNARRFFYYQVLTKLNKFFSKITKNIILIIR